MNKALILSLGMCLGLFCLTNMTEAASVKTTSDIAKSLNKLSGIAFPLGNFNESNKRNFTGDSYVARLNSKDGVNVANVTFVQGAHTFWHIHHGTCQVILPVLGKGYYQIWGQEPQQLKLGETVVIPEGIKHWHGAAKGQTFQHVVVTGPAKYTTEWLEPVDNKVFQNLK